MWWPRIREDLDYWSEDESENIVSEFTDKKRIINNWTVNLNANKLDNLDAIGTLLGTEHQTVYEIENLSPAVTVKSLV